MERKCSWNKGHTEMKKGKTQARKLQKNGLLMFAAKLDWPYAAMGTLFMVLASLGSPAQTLIYGKIFLKLSNFLQGDYESAHRFLKDIRVLCLSIIGVGLVRMLLTWLSIYVWLLVGERNLIRARKKVLALILKKDLAWLDSKVNLMGTLAQANRSIEEIRSGISENLASLVQSILSMVFLFINAMVSLWSLTLVIMASVPVMAMSTLVFGGLTFKFQKRENDLGARASKILDWSFVNGDLVRLLNGKFADMVAFNKLVDSSAKAFYRMAMSISGNASALRFLANCIFVQGFLFGGYLMSRGKLKIDQLFTAFSSCLILGVQISATAAIIALLNKAKAAACTIESSQLLNVEEADQSEKVGKHLGPVELSKIRSIEVLGVSYKYESGKENVLSNISATFHSSGINFIVGESGCGKSTLILLLMSFYTPNEGSIQLGDMPLSQIHPLQLFEIFTLAETKPMVFDGLLLENLTLGFESISDSKLEEACKFARLQLEVASFHQGYQQSISSSTLSGGQIQKIGLARAWIRNPPILILDESLSAVDSTSRDQILADIRIWRQGKITIFVTHHLLDIEEFDLVLLLDQGRIKFKGLRRDMPHEYFTEKTFDNLLEVKSSCRESIFLLNRNNRRSIFDYLHNPHILHDLEEKGQTKENLALEPLPIMAIAKFCLSAMNSRTLMVSGLFLSLISGLGTPFLSFFVSKLLATAISAAAYGSNISGPMLRWCLVLIGVALTDGIIYFLSQTSLQIALENWIVDLRKNALATIDEQDMSFFNGQFLKPAELTALLMNDSRDLRVLVSEFVSSLLLLIALTLLGVTWAIVSGWKLALVGVAFVPLILLVTTAYGIVLSSLETSYKDKVALAENFSHNIISGVKTIKCFGLDSWIQSEYNKKLGDIQDVGRKRAFATGLGIALLELLTSIATGVILYYGVSLVASSDYSQGELVQVITILTFTLTSASSLVHQIPEITRGKRAGLKFHWLSDLGKLDIETNGDVRVHNLRRSNPLVTFENIDFSYPDKSTTSYKRVLKNISFSLQSGQRVALVGKSGSGKSTIASLLGRLYEQDRGRITFADHDLSSLDVDFFREAVVVVTQHPRFFEGTIFQNLTYGLRNRDVSEELVWEKLQQCLIADFVRSLPEGLNTIIGEASNVKASMGQMQRLSLCRGLIRKPKLLILDECTSNLDRATGDSIIDLVCNKMQKYNREFTVLFVTHDSKVMKAVSRILMLDNGGIVEDGHYDELLQRRSHFYNLVNSTFE